MTYQGDQEYTISALFFNPSVDSKYNDEHVWGNTAITDGSGDMNFSYDKKKGLQYKVNDGTATYYDWPDGWLDNWHLITLVVNGTVGNGTFKMYIDGNLYSTTNRGTLNSPNTLGLLGLYEPGGYRMEYNGSWADYRVFNRALSVDEINKMKNALNI